MMDKALKRLKGRKQKLYIHASVKGRALSRCVTASSSPAGAR